MKKQIYSLLLLLVMSTTLFAEQTSVYKKPKTVRYIANVAWLGAGLVGFVPSLVTGVAIMGMGKGSHGAGEVGLAVVGAGTTLSALLGALLGEQIGILTYSAAHQVRPVVVKASIEHQLPFRTYKPLLKAAAAKDAQKTAYFLAQAFEQLFGEQWKETFSTMVVDWQKVLEIASSAMPHQDKITSIEATYDKKYTLDQRKSFVIGTRIILAIYKLYFGKHIKPEVIEYNKTTFEHRIEIIKRIGLTFNDFLMYYTAPNSIA